ncbi:MAG TPA: PAS domain S-box protein [Deltaproteobacteria bacterium]|mgnify:FL=1|nr:PAS domain S-box protein [Deltaproteobacteria bacterium]
MPEKPTYKDLVKKVEQLEERLKEYGNNPDSFSGSDDRLSQDTDNRHDTYNAPAPRTLEDKFWTGGHPLDIKRLERSGRNFLENEEYYRLLAENVRDVIWALDLKGGNFTYFSPSVEGLLGYTPQEAMSLSVEKILTPESNHKATMLFAEELMRQQRKEVDTGEGHLSLDLEHVRKDGSTVWAELSVTFMEDEHGEPAELFGITRDITERKLIEDALRQSEEKYRTILENIEDGYIEIDLSGTFTFANVSACRMLGFTHDEMIGMNYRQYTSPETARRMYEVFHEITITGNPAYLVDYEVIHKDGSVRVHEMSVSLIRDFENKPKGFRGIARDVTEHRRAEVALRQSEEKYRTILESIEDGYFEVDLKGDLTFFNNSFSRIWGYPKDELMGMNNREYTSENMAKKVSRVFRQIYYTGKPGRVSDYEIFCKEGSTRILEIYASLIRDSHDKPAGYRGIARDVTERKRLEYQLMQAQKMESIGTLAGGIAHDFNNLLMGVLGNISLMLMGRDEQDKDYERLKNIEQYVMRGSELTKRLLGFARGGKYEVKPTDLKGFIERSADMFGQTKKEIMIHRKFQQDLWAVEVDQGQMEQVLLNLFVNAWQAMPAGGHLYLEGANVELGEEDVEPYGIETGRYVKITVSDTGVGMDDDVRAKVFDPFFTTKDRGRGTGLGLASVYGIVKNHGGFIIVESEKGKGSSFHIYLPASSRSVEQPRGMSEKVKPGAGTVLLVDDEEMIIDVASEMLRRMGYEVLGARNGKDALEMYKKNPGMIDIVILDMIMPEMGGSQTYDRLKAIDPDVKVLLSSGYSRDGQAEEILKKGCLGFIQKPFNMKDLSQKIAEILGGK